MSKVPYFSIVRTPQQIDKPTIDNTPCHDLIPILRRDNDCCRYQGPKTHSKHTHASTKMLAQPTPEDNTYTSVSLLDDGQEINAPIPKVM